MKAILIALTAAALAVAATPTSAQPSALEDQYSVTIPYGDLNLNSGAGKLKLAQRIRAGSRAACGTIEVGPWSQRLQVETCQRGFREQARQKADLALRDDGITLAAAASK